MKRPEPVWETEYKSDRRKHNHRCFCCKKIIQPGERVLMCLFEGRRTRACHASHADNIYAQPYKMTVRNVMRHWGLGALKRKGWTVKDCEFPQEEQSA